jgi:hypothetical protein
MESVKEIGVFEFEMLKDIVTLRISGCVCLESTLETRGEVANGGFETVDLRAISASHPETGRFHLLPQSKIGCSWGRIPTQPHDALVWYANIEEILKKLV